jgi:hypothetical protein
VNLSVDSRHLSRGGRGINRPARPRGTLLTRRNERSNAQASINEEWPSQSKVD